MNPRDVLAFERQWWRKAGSKETAIIATFGCSVIRYYQRLNEIIDTPEALELDAQTVRRLQRVRAQRLAS